MDQLIRASGLVRRFDGEAAVDGIDLDVESGEIHAIVGLNGAGKTTLMRLVLGMLRPQAGTAQILGHEAWQADVSIWRHVGCAVESPFAYPELTVRENLESAALLHGMPRTDFDDEIERAIDRFELRRWAGRRASTLSLGNRQRLGLAAALVHEPSILVLDEPANALDPAGVVFIRELLRASADRGAAVMVSSHHFDQLARVADRITVLHRGRVVGKLDADGADLEQQFFEMVHAADQARRGAST